jgi:hypothetical protein
MLLKERIPFLIGALLTAIILRWGQVCRADEEGIVGLAWAPCMPPACVQGRPLITARHDSYFVSCCHLSIRQSQAVIRPRSSPRPGLRLPGSGSLIVKRQYHDTYDLCCHAHQLNPIRTGYNISPLWNEIRQPVPERIWSKVRDKEVTPVVKQGFSIHSFGNFLWTRCAFTFIHCKSMKTCL